MFKDLGAPGITAITDSEAKSVLGKSIRLDDDSARFVMALCKAPGYTVSRERTDEALIDYRTSIERLPLVGNAVEALDVQCEDSVSYRLLRLENGCVLFVLDGRFFQLAHPDKAATATRTNCIRDKP